MANIFYLMYSFCFHEQKQLNCNQISEAGHSTKNFSDGTQVTKEPTVSKNRRRYLPYFRFLQRLVHFRFFYWSKRSTANLCCPLNYNVTKISSYFISNLFRRRVIVSRFSVFVVLSFTAVVTLFNVLVLIANSNQKVMSICLSLCLFVCLSISLSVNLLVF